MVASESNLITAREQAGLDERSSVTKSAALLSQKNMSFKDRSAV